MTSKSEIDLTMFPVQAIVAYIALPIPSSILSEELKGFLSIGRLNGVCLAITYVTEVSVLDHSGRKF